jgi:hypothetical protein
MLTKCPSLCTVRDQQEIDEALAVRAFILARGGDVQGGQGAIVKALERARVIGVLDAWASSPFDGTSVHARRVSAMPAHMGSGWRCYLQIGVGAMNCRAHKFSGATPDAARAAAAKAIEAGDV